MKILSYTPISFVTICVPKNPKINIHSRNFPFNLLKVILIAIQRRRSHLKFSKRPNEWVASENESWSREMIEKHDGGFFSGKNKQSVFLLLLFFSSTPQHSIAFHFKYVCLGIIGIIPRYFSTQLIISIFDEAMAFVTYFCWYKITQKKQHKPKKIVENVSAKQNIYDDERFTYTLFFLCIQTHNHEMFIFEPFIWFGFTNKYVILFTQTEIKFVDLSAQHWIAEIIILIYVHWLNEIHCTNKQMMKLYDKSYT